MKSAIVYASRHHGNTEKLVKELAERHGIDLINAELSAEINLDAYDVIGFASGIDFGQFYPFVTAIAAQMPAGKCTYALYTCAKNQARYGNEIEQAAQARNCRYLGKFGCRGFNTYGPLKLIGGMNKGCPGPEEIAAAVEFYEKMVMELVQ